MVVLTAFFNQLLSLFLVMERFLLVFFSSLSLGVPAYFISLILILVMFLSFFSSFKSGVIVMVCK